MKAPSAPSFSTQQVDLCRRLREEIILGHLNHGQKITEKFLSERMGVNRGPARESLLILEGEGLIRKVPSIGYFVESFSEDDVHDVYEIRLTVETLAARRAALHASRESLVQLALICEEEHKAAQRGDVEARLRCDLDFHTGIVLASGSRLLVRTHGSIARPFFGEARLPPERAVRVVAEHAAVYEAIRDHDPEAAAARIRAHILEHDASDREASASRSEHT